MDNPTAKKLTEMDTQELDAERYRLIEMFVEEKRKEKPDANKLERLEHKLIEVETEMRSRW